MDKFDIICLVNDDGIHAHGIKILEELCVELFSPKLLYVFAPMQDKSGSGQSVSLNSEIEITKISDTKFGIHGTPADCIQIAISKVLGNQKPDLILSGINAGANIGFDTLYSGTVAGATEGMLSGITSISISQYYQNDKIFFINTLLKTTIKKLVVISKSLDNKYIFNVNIPCSEPSGIKVLSQEDFKTNNTFEMYRNIVRVKIDEKVDKFNIEGHPLTNGYITITPILLDRTATHIIRYLQDAI